MQRHVFPLSSPEAIEVSTILASILFCTWQCITLRHLCKLLVTLGKVQLHGFVFFFPSLALVSVTICSWVVGSAQSHATLEFVTCGVTLPNFSLL